MHGRVPVCRWLSDEINMAKIEIYTTDHCAYCTRAKMVLDQKGVDYTEINVEKNPEKMAEMMERSGNRTVPQIFINDKNIGGFDDLWALEKQKKLDELLK